MKKMILRDTKLSKIGRFSDFKGVFKGFYVPFPVTKFIHAILCRKLIPFSYSIEQHRKRMAENLMPDMTVRLFHGIYLYLSKKKSYLYFTEVANEDHVRNIFPLITRVGPTLYRKMHRIFPEFALLYYLEYHKQAVKKIRHVVGYRQRLSRKLGMNLL